MKAAFRKSISKQIARLLIVVLGLFILNNAVFLHAHRLSNGEIILHAHPYNKSQDPAPIKTHHHTAAELFSIAHLQLLFFVLVTLSATVFRTGHKRIYSYIYPFLFLEFSMRTRGRSPPITCRMDLQPV
ncbi:hypothetical protein [uncultured Proteiniphilum sp.]|uniref:hypothetical protein n=1 Tax=uncultured Proteiniphilum sp. TaxID=497637 RepID=UPI002618DE7B|nr:hypothetical protein [uncultured Proteiniphilum sp.]